MRGNRSEEPKKRGWFKRVAIAAAGIAATSAVFVVAKNRAANK